MDGYQKADAMIEETTRPTYTESDYKIICPVASGQLPLRAEWLELYSQNYTEEDIKEQIQALVDEHNKVHNPDGIPHTTADHKRSASAAGLSERETGVEIPEDASAPKNVTELTAKDGPISMITVRGQQFHFTKSGHLWINSTSDDILPCGLCVALIFGKFFVNEHVEAEKVKKGDACLDWNMTSESHAGVFMCEGFQQKFSDDVASTLGDCIAYLAQNGVVEPHVECHNLKTDFTKDE